MNRARLKLVLAGEVVALAIVLALIPTAALAHHIDITRTCNTVTVQSYSDGTMSVLAQTGGVFAVGQTAPPGNPGLLTEPAQPGQVGSVTVTWTTDHSQETVGWGESADCVPVTTTSTAPSTTTTEHPTTTTTAAPSTTTTLPITTTTLGTTTTTARRETTTTQRPTTTTTAGSSTSTVCTADDVGSACDRPQPAVPGAIPAAPAFTG